MQLPSKGLRFPFKINVNCFSQSDIWASRTPCQDVKSQNAPPLTPKKCWRRLSPGILAFGSNAKQRDTETLLQWSCKPGQLPEPQQPDRPEGPSAPLQSPTGAFGRLQILRPPAIPSTTEPSPPHLQLNHHRISFLGRDLQN